MRDGTGQVFKIETYFVKKWPRVPLFDINALRIQNWRREQVKRGLSPAGINRPVSALKAMLNRAVEWQVIESNPLATLRPLKEDDRRQVRYLNEDEENALRAALNIREVRQREERESYNRWCDQRQREQLPYLDGVFSDYLKPMVLLALNTGMRRGELFDLRVDDVSLTAGTNREGRIMIRGAKSKSGDSRIIPLTQEAKRVLKAWIDQTAPENLVFPSPVSGKRFNNINKAWQTLRESAGIHNFRFHDLRHSFASKLAMKAVDLYVIKELLGHRSIETTQRYAHLGPDYKTNAIEKLN
jgi:integrase